MLAAGITSYGLFIEDGVDEMTLLQRTEETPISEVEQVRAGYAYFALAQYDYVREELQDRAPLYLEKALGYLQKNTRWKDTDISYTIWFNISTLHAFPIHLHQHKICTLTHDAEVAVISQELNAINHALQFHEKVEAIFRKFLFLHLLESLGEKLPESPMPWLRLYLGRCPDRSSSQYKAYAYLYGECLANQGDHQEAKKWLPYSQGYSSRSRCLGSDATSSLSL